MKYLIRINNELYGYDNPELLKVDILTYNPKNYDVYQKTEGIKLVYKKLKKELLTEEL
jgi:hypothetical protein